MLTPREATEAPTQRSRSQLSPTDVTELATVRLFLILSSLLCSLRPGFCIVCDFAHARPIMLQHSTSYYSNTVGQYQELMKEGASNCVERHLTIATLPFYGHILKWGISVVFIANALRRTPRVCVIPRAICKRTYVYIAWR